MSDDINIFTFENGYTYVDLTKIRTREQANRVILVILDKLISEFPEWRFQQLLWNINMSDTTDKFHEESKTTLETLLNDRIVSKFFKVKPPVHVVEKAEILNFNEYRSNKD